MKIPSWLEPLLRAGVWVCRPKYLVGVFPVCIDDRDHVLLINKRLGASTGWQLPGGAKECGVSFEESACKELAQETGLEATARDARFVTVRCVEEYRDVNMVYLMVRWKGTVAPQDTIEIQAARWVPFHEAYKILPPSHQVMLTSAVEAWYRCGLAFS